MENIMEIRGLSKKFPEFSLKQVSFSVPKGSVVGFIGENGAGKSTTIKLILNLMFKDSGTITVFGKDHLKNDKKMKEDIGVVLDECNFPDSTKLKDVNRIMRRVYKNWQENVFFSLTAKLGLSKQKSVKEYSRGMKMKLMIAVALSHKAKLLLLDEATSGLDPIVRDEILDVFFDFIQDEEHSILMSSHITSDLEKIADYIVFIHQGRIIFAEPKDQLLEKYGVLKCSEGQLKRLNQTDIIGIRRNEFGVEALVNRNNLPTGYMIDKASLEDIMLFHIRGHKE